MMTVLDPCLGAGLIVSGVWLVGVTLYIKARAAELLFAVLNQRETFPGRFFTSLTRKGSVLDAASLLAMAVFAVGLPAGRCSLEKASPVLFMLVTASCQCCPTGPVQGPHRRTGASLLCGAVHYG